MGWQTIHCSVQPNSGAWSVINSISAIKVSPHYHFSLSSYMMFVKVVFGTPHEFKLSKMDVKNEERSVITFCCLWKKSAVETVKLMHEAYADEEQLGDLTIFHWHKTSEGRETAALLPRVGQPLSICTEEMVNTIAAAVWEDQQITVRQFSQALDISELSVHSILRFSAC